MSTTVQNPRRILFVDDDVAFLETMKELMNVFSAGQWEIQTAQSASQAFAALQQQAIDLAVIDVQMPVMDGIQMLSLLNRSYPNVQKVVMTGFASEKYRAACLGSGAELFLEKPKTRDELHSLFATLNELMKLRPAQGFHGVLRPVELLEVVQLECTEGNSSVVEIKSEGVEGRLYIKEGALVHAVAGGRKGSAALDFLLSLRGGEFKLLPFAEPPERTLDGPWEALLLRAAQMREPARAAGPGQVAPGALRVATSALPVPPVPAKTSTPAPPEATRPQVEELLICSAFGDVLYGWQCHDTDVWVKLLEFISQKAQRLAQGMTLGDFNRLEIQTQDERIVMIVSPDRGVIVRTKRPPSAVGPASAGRNLSGAGVNESDGEIQERTADWLRRAPLARGVLVRGVRFADQTVVCDLDSRDFPRAAIEQAYRSAADTYAVLKAHQVPSTRLLWRYSRAALHCALRGDGAILGAFVSPKAEEADLATLDQLLSDFSEPDPTHG